MSVQAFDWVLRYSESRLGPRHVLISIANHANREGRGAYPSIRTIAHEARLCVREVQYAIRILTKSGELTVERGAGPGGTNSYSLPLMVQTLHREGVQTGVQNPARNKDEQKQPESNPPKPPFSKGGHSYRLTHRDHTRLARYWEKDRSKPRDPGTGYTWPELLRMACADLAISLEDAKHDLLLMDPDLWAARLELKKTPQSAPDIVRETMNVRLKVEAKTPVAEVTYLPRNEYGREMLLREAEFLSRKALAT